MEWWSINANVSWVSCIFSMFISKRSRKVLLCCRNLFQSALSVAITMGLLCHSALELELKPKMWIHLRYSWLANQYSRPNVPFFHVPVQVSWPAPPFKYGEPYCKHSWWRWTLHCVLSQSCNAPVASLLSLVQKNYIRQQLRIVVWTKSL